MLYPGISFGPDEAIKSLQVFVVEAQPEESKVCVQGVKRNHRDIEQNETRRKIVIRKHRKQLRMYLAKVANLVKPVRLVNLMKLLNQVKRMSIVKLVIFPMIMMVVTQCAITIRLIEKGKINQ